MNAKQTGRTTDALAVLAGVILLAQGVWIATPLFWQAASGEGGLGPWSEGQITYLWRVICGGWIGVCGWAYLSGWLKKTEVAVLLALFHLYLIIGVIAYFGGGGEDRLFGLMLGIPHAVLILLPLARLWNPENY